MGTRVLFSCVVAALCTPIALMAQQDRPIHPLTPAYDPHAQPEAASKPKVYDEQADARQQIAGALEKAKKENRRVLIQWGGNWCGWCLKLHELYGKDPEIKKELLYEYDVVFVDAGQKGKNMDLAKSYGATCDKDGFPYLTVLDGTGKAIANHDTSSLETDHNLAAGHDPKKMLEFLKEHEAPHLDAQKVLDEGIADARKEGKRVFLHFGAPWCVWCHRLEDWMARPEVKAILAKDFIDLKIDTERTVGGSEVFTRYTFGKPMGIPYFVFLDSDGKPIANSKAPSGNIGFPAQPAEIAYFTEMLKKAAVKMTPADIETIAGTLGKDADAAAH